MKKDLKKQRLIYFYLPNSKLVNGLPEAIEDFWDWYPEKEKALQAAAWILQTYLYLRSSGWNCKLVSELPAKGIVVTFTKSLTPDLKPNHGLYFVCVRSDMTSFHLYSNYYIVMNKDDSLMQKPWSSFFKASELPHWPMPGLIARDVLRGNRFENICYFGRPWEFSDEVGQLAEKLREHGFNWKMVPPERWHDFSEVDAIVALRSKSGLRRSKSAQKLINAWLASVPAILSTEPGFRQMRKGVLDYIEANTAEEVLKALISLRNDEPLRQAMIESGRQRVRQFSAEQTLVKWERLLVEEIIPDYERWQKSGLQRARFLMGRKMTRLKLALDYLCGGKKKYYLYGKSP